MTTDESMSTVPGERLDDRPSCTESDILRALRRMRRDHGSTSRSAVAALGLACFIVGASARDLGGYFVSPEPVPFYLTDAYRHRCGLLISQDGTVLDDEFRPMGYYPGTHWKGAGPENPWPSVNSEVDVP